MRSISVVLSVRNEERYIERVLRSVSWADEIIVVDNESTDKTPDIAKSFGAKVYRKKNDPMLNKNKNLGFEQATKEWILNLDGDEEVTDELRYEIQDLLKKDSIAPDGYWISRKNIIFGKWIRHGLWWPDKQLRLFRRGKGRFPCNHIHEYLIVDGKTADLSSPILHHNYDSISQFLRKMDAIYTENEVLHLRQTGKQIVWHDAIRMPVSDFIKIYFAQQGYKDGMHGLVLAMLQAFYAFIVFAKTWEKDGFHSRDVALSDVSKELKKAKKELNYWIIHEQTQETKSILHRFLFRIRLGLSRYL